MAFIWILISNNIEILVLGGKTAPSVCLFRAACEYVEYRL